MRAGKAVYATLWNGLSAMQQKAVRAIASDPKKPFSAEVTQRFGISATSTLSRAVDALVARGIPLRSGREIGFDSPFFQEWVRREVLPDVTG